MWKQKYFNLKFKTISTLLSKKILSNENITALINLRLLLYSDHTLWNAVAQYVGYMTAYRKSNKKNTCRKKTQFKKGHKLTSTLKESYTDNSSRSSVSVVQKPSSGKFADALSVQYTSKCHFDILPTKLRPVKIKDENYFAISEESEDNIIII